MSDAINVVGAQEHNLKSLDVSLPRDSLVVITGLSGSGKSSLAFDTIYQEGQRRFMESLSSYARQFLGKMDKPRVERVGPSQSCCTRRATCHDCEGVREGLAGATEEEEAFTMTW